MRRIMLLLAIAASASAQLKVLQSTDPASYIDLNGNFSWLNTNKVGTSDARLTDPRTPLSHVHLIADVTDLQTALDGKQAALGFTAVPTTRQVAGHALSADVTVTKSDVSLGNVDNTSDANKPVSTAQQAALDLKAPLANPGFTGTISVGTPPPASAPPAGSINFAGSLYQNGVLFSGGGSGTAAVVVTFDTTAGTCTASAGSCVAAAGPPITLTVTHGLNNSHVSGWVDDSGGLVGSNIVSAKATSANVFVWTFAAAQAGTATIDTAGMGAPGTNGQSVTTVSEASGANCTYGGWKLTSISGTSYVCNGAPGGTGGNGASVTATVEGNGANCTYGGWKFVSSSGTSYVCNGAPGGGAGTVTQVICGAGLTGGTITSTGTCALATVTSAQMAVVNTRRTCTMLIGASNGAALAALDIAPQIKQCKIPAAGHVVEISVDADAGTSSVQVQKRHCSTITAGACTAWTNTNLLSAELPTLTGGFPSCAMSSTAQTCIDGTTSHATITVSTTAVAAGDYLEPSTATLVGTPKLYAISVTWAVDEP